MDNDELTEEVFYEQCKKARELLKELKSLNVLDRRAWSAIHCEQLALFFACNEDVNLDADIKKMSLYIKKIAQEMRKKAEDGQS